MTATQTPIQSQTTLATTIQTLREPRIAQMAIFDIVGSLLVGIIVARYILHLHGPAKIGLFLVAWTLFGVIVHKFMGINTMLGFYLGVNDKPERAVASS